MYEDLGGVAAGDVKNLEQFSTQKGENLFFQTTPDEAQKALLHYFNISTETMYKYFAEDMNLDLALSLAREGIEGKQRKQARAKDRMSQII